MAELRGGIRQGAGRPKGAKSLLAQRTREYIAKMLDKEIGPIIEVAIQQAKSGNKDARDFLFDRSHGKARQQVGIDGGEDKPFEIQISEVIARKNGLR